MPNETLNAYAPEQLAQEKVVPERISSVSHDIEVGERQRLEVMLESVEDLTVNLNEHTDERYAYMGSIGMYLLMNEMSSQQEDVTSLMILEQRIAGGKNDFDIGLSPESKVKVMQDDFGWDKGTRNLQRGYVGDGRQMVDVLEKTESDSFPYVEVSIGNERALVQHPEEALFEKMHALIDPGLDEEGQPREGEIKWGVDIKLLKTYLMLSENMDEQGLEEHLAKRWEQFQFERRYGNISRLSQQFVEGTTPVDVLTPVVEARTGKPVTDLRTELTDILPDADEDTVDVILTAETPEALFEGLKTAMDTTLPEYKDYSEAQMVASEAYQELLAGTETDKFPQSFFENTWSHTLIGQESTIDVTGNESAYELAEKMYAELVPSLDAYIEKYDVPAEKLPDESDEAFFERVNDTLYNLNEANVDSKGWRDCWASTAIDIGRTNCALGSLVVARALEKAGYEDDDVQYGFPGPMTHAVIIAKGKYIDQANGVVLDIEKDSIVDDIQTYRVVEHPDAEKMEKVPFRRIPVTTAAQGVAPLVWNMGSMIHRGDKTAEELIERFNLDRTNPYGNLGRKNLLEENWSQKRMTEQSEWQQEKEEVDARFAQ